MYYHYTDIGSFYNIVANQSVWFSNLSYMNDELEGLEFIRVLREMVSNEDSTEYQMLNSTVNQLSEIFLPDKYLFSSTQLFDDISQWRAYTTIGKGICFGFNDGFIADKTVKQVHCIYDLEAKQEFIKSQTKLISYKNSEFSSEKRKNGSVSELVGFVLRGMETFKHNSFSSEKEVRWIDDLNSKTEREIYFRPHKLGLLPYRAVPIDITKISEIILGPQVPKQNIATLYKLLKNFHHIQITSSSVTLR